MISIFQAVNLYNDGLVDAYAKKYSSAEINLKNALKKLDELDGMSISVEDNVLSVKALLSAGLSSLMPIEIGCIVDVIGKSKGGYEASSYGVIIRNCGMEKYDCALKHQNNSDNEEFDILDCEVVVNYDGKGDWRKAKSAKKFNAENKIPIKFYLDEKIEYWDADHLYCLCLDIPTDDIILDKYQVNDYNYRRLIVGSDVECNCYNLGVWYPCKIISVKQKNLSEITVDILLSIGMLLVDVSESLIRQQNRGMKVGSLVRVMRTDFPLVSTL